MARKKTKPYSLLWKSTFVMVILIFPLNLLSLLSAELIFKRAVESLDYSMELTLNTYINALDNRIDTINTQLFSFPYSDPSCIELLKQEDDWHYTLYRQSVYKTLRENMVLSNSADAFFFYMKKKEDIMVIQPASSTPIDVSDFYSLLEKDSLWNAKWHLEDIGGQPCLVWLYDQDTYCTGALICLEPLITELLSVSDYEHMAVSFTDTPVQAAKKTLVCSVPSQKASVWMNLQIDEHEVFRNISLWQKLLFCILLLYLLVLPVFYVLFRRHVTYPLDILNTAHQELKRGNEDYRITALPASKDFDTAYSSFNTMADTLQNLQLENISKELAAKQLQLSNLQMQIRPHFLLNTMNLLYTLIQTHQEAPARKMILYLSNYFRYMFRSGNDLSMFDREMALVKEYLHVSSFHYPDAFDISYQIDPTLSMVRVPSLLLHNFVENIISHSLIHGRVIHIVFYAEYENGQVTIQISDDGRGMPPEDVELINRADFSHIPDGQHVGIRNSVQRLKYYYGEHAFLEVESQLDIGTTFTIGFPYDLEVEKI